MDLPPGFRFHPTDEELITHYLLVKVSSLPTPMPIITEIDLNKVEPWDLPGKARIGEKEWYFFYMKDRKYPTGLRTNRATESGYWKATGKDKEILRGKSLVGMKKTLVFYKGRAPRGEKTCWIMHEYRLEGRNGPRRGDEWVICRIFNKKSGGADENPAGGGSGSCSEARNWRFPSVMEEEEAQETTTLFGYLQNEDVGFENYDEVLVTSSESLWYF
ncbi:hypothetical protein M569_08928 [Genlisea aurea]|uniref:NAC domain-containing protein n=1 Tax=Genlisea aurea TaxID=192259 RepID=S8CG30_9LAMI|nr:hypothetical protein M569_08928 [Genlisea aurea]